MTAVFADTFYWTALTHPSDFHRKQALALESELLGRTLIVTTQEVLVEYLAFFANRGRYWRSHAAAIVRGLPLEPGVQVLAQSAETFARGLDIYESRPDKAYSLTDCISMETMRRDGILDVLTHDRHFEQEGFRAPFR
jgi:predicted nucleic acid-binding protein